ncbi:MAG TPA: DUF5681 domain-containing protein [Saprospiraceae bacterium]|nr:DUF5681 domain-containing protein [Saprospiraceae bacterium]
MKENQKKPALEYQNLRPWKPGQSGNSIGREKGSKNLKTLLKKALLMKVDWIDIDGKKSRMPVKEVMVMHVVNKAISNQGDIDLIFKIIDLIEGKKSGPGVQVNIGQVPIREVFEIGGRKIEFGPRGLEQEEE